MSFIMKPRLARTVSSPGKAGLVARVPLLCWDVPHPQLSKQQELASDVASFARLATDLNWQSVPDLRRSLAEGRTIVVTDRSSQIMWVSRGFSRLTGYESCEMLGKTPALLQEPLTSATTRSLVRRRLARCEAATITLQNYRKDQTPTGAE